MIISRTVRDEVKAIVDRLLDNLAAMVSSQTGNDGAKLRMQIGRVRSNFRFYIDNGTFADELLLCFTYARETNVKLSSLAHVREHLFLETPVAELSLSLKVMAVMFCLTAESRMISATEFTSRDDVEAMMSRMKAAFDTARDMVTELDDPHPYQTVMALAGALTRFLADAARPLPRMVTFKLQAAFPSLVLSQMLYYDPARAEEIIAENHIVHPAFCLRELRGLSA
jgi:prophage DNA circulation protein